MTLTDGTRLPYSFLFLFLGASPCTEWLGDCVARDEKGFIRTGSEIGAEGLLETSVPRVYAAGDVRAGSIKRCAIAVGEGAAVVRFVHEHLAPSAVKQRAERNRLDLRSELAVAQGVDGEAGGVDQLDLVALEVGAHLPVGAGCGEDRAAGESGDRDTVQMAADDRPQLRMAGDDLG